jgi:hypothetical protein
MTWFRTSAPWTLLAVCTLLGCRQKTYDFAPAQQTLEAATPVGSTPEQVLSALDSLGFRHSPFDPSERSITASMREPDPDRMVFGTLRVTLRFNQGRRLVERESRVVYTGP